MSRSRSFVVVLASLASVAGLVPAGPAWAAPSTPSTLTYDFTDCDGPTGTPEAFDAVKQPGGAAALHLTDGGSIFVAISATDVLTEDLLFTTPGFQQNELPTVSCSVINPTNDRLQRVTGLIVPAG
jgi:hypothetical protein